MLHSVQFSNPKVLAWSPQVFSPNHLIILRYVICVLLSYPDLCIPSPLSHTQYLSHPNLSMSHLYLKTHHLEFDQAHLNGPNIASLNGFIPPARPFCCEHISISFSGKDNMIKASSRRSVPHQQSMSRWDQVYPSVSLFPSISDV